MPLASQSSYDQIHNRFLASFTFAAKPLGMTFYTPSITFSFDKRCLSIEWVSTFGAKKVPNMPLPATCDDYLAFNRGLAVPAAGTELFVKIEMTIES